MKKHNKSTHQHHMLNKVLRKDSNLDAPIVSIIMFASTDKLKT